MTSSEEEIELDSPFEDDYKFIIKDPSHLEPIVRIVNLPGNWDDNINLRSKKKYVKTKSGKKGKKASGTNAKNEVYKNPFVYDNINKKQHKYDSSKKFLNKSKWTCLICNENLDGKDSLIQHYEAHKDAKIEIDNEPKQEKSKFYQCDLCFKEFSSDMRFEKHLESHNVLHLTCEYCRKVFKSPYTYAVHIRLHTNEKKLKCYMCEYKTVNNSLLESHLKTHESDYKYKCEICGKGYFVYSWFEEHKNLHTGAKPFACDVCGDQFTFTRDLIAHKRSTHDENITNLHTSLNECEFCKKRFANSKTLVTHMRSHTGENTVLCDICGKGLSSKAHLKIHRRIHTGCKPFCCTVCGKGFAKKCNLTLHERVHSGEKPYECKVCGKCFSQRSTLVIHNRYHTGDRPYTCHLCNKGFVAKGVLTIHLKSCDRRHMSYEYD